MLADMFEEFLHAAYGPNIADMPTQQRLALEDAYMAGALHHACANNERLRETLVAVGACVVRGR